MNRPLSLVWTAALLSVTLGQISFAQVFDSSDTIQPAQSSAAGSWRGTATSELDSGQMVTFPVTIRIESSPSGLTARVEADVKAPSEGGQPVTLNYRGRFSGSATSPTTIRLTGSQVSLKVAETGEVMPIDTQYVLGTIDGNTLTGTIGSDEDGWTQFKVTKATSTPNPVKPNAGPVGTSTLKVALDPLVAGMPNAASVKAPRGFRPGMRMTFWLGAADENGNLNQPTIQRDANGKSVDMRLVPTGNAGSGFIHIDIMAVTDQLVAMKSTQYLGDGTVSPPTPSQSNTLVCHPSGCEYWINPELLARVQPGEVGGVRYLRGPHEANGKTYDALMIKVKSANATSHNVFDMKTGISLSMGARMISKKDRNQVTVMASQLKAVRQIDLPWVAFGMAPQQVGQTLRYRGQQTLDMGMGYPTSMPINMTLSRSHVDSSIVQYDVTTTLPQQSNTPFRSKSYTAAGELGNVIMPTQALAALKTGQEIDQDPVTGYRTFVEHVGQNEMGQALVVIRESGQSGLQRWVYDANSGLLLEAMTQYSQGQPATTTTIKIQLIQ